MCQKLLNPRLALTAAYSSFDNIFFDSEENSDRELFHIDANSFYADLVRKNPLPTGKLFIDFYAHFFWYISLVKEFKKSLLTKRL